MKIQELVYQIEHKISMLETRLVGQGRQLEACQMYAVRLESEIIDLKERVDKLTNPL